MSQPNGDVLQESSPSYRPFLNCPAAQRTPSSIFRQMTCTGETVVITVLTHWNPAQILGSWHVERGQVFYRKLGLMGLPYQEKAS